MRRTLLYLVERETYRTLGRELRPDPQTASRFFLNVFRASTYRNFLLAVFRPEFYNLTCNDLTDDEMLVHDVACEFDCTPAEVVDFAAKHADVRYSMDDFYVEPRLPWRVRQFIRENSPLS